MLVAFCAFKNKKGNSKQRNSKQRNSKPDFFIITNLGGTKVELLLKVGIMMKEYFDFGWMKK